MGAWDDNLGELICDSYYFPVQSYTTILIKTFGTLCLSRVEITIQVVPPPHQDSVIVLGVINDTHFTHLAQFIDPSLNGGGGLWGRNLSKVVFMSLYCWLPANSIHKMWNTESA